SFTRCAPRPGGHGQRLTPSLGPPRGPLQNLPMVAPWFGASKAEFRHRNSELLLLRRIESQQLHLDKAGRVERELTGLERRAVAVARPRGELDHDLLVTLDQRVDEQLVG